MRLGLALLPLLAGCVKRVLYGSDLSPPGGSVRAGWDIFRSKVPLTPSELQVIAGNQTRFAR